MCALINAIQLVRNSTLLLSLDLWYIQPFSLYIVHLPSFHRQTGTVWRSRDVCVSAAKWRRCAGPTSATTVGALRFARIGVQLRRRCRWLPYVAPSPALHWPSSSSPSASQSCAAARNGRRSSASSTRLASHDPSWTRQRWLWARAHRIDGARPTQAKEVNTQTTPSPLYPSQRDVHFLIFHLLYICIHRTYVIRDRLIDINSHHPQSQFC